MKMRIWITVSHPGMSRSDVMGDMVRIKTLARAIALLGHEVTIICSSDDERPCPEMRQARPRTLGSWSPKWLLPVSLRSTVKDIGYMAGARSFLNRLRERSPAPDLIVDYSFYWSDAALRYGAECGAPVVLNVETMTEDSMPAVACSCLRPLGRRDDRRRLAAASRIWSVSSPLADSLVEFQPQVRGRIDVIPNAADLPLDTDIDSSILRLPEGSEPLVVFVGSLAPWYQVPRLVMACRRARSQVPGLRLMLVGDGPDRGVIEKGLSADDRRWCELTGSLPHAEVATRLRSATICVIMNHTWWGSPLKLLEYGSLGKPVIAASVPSIQSMVSSSEVEFVQPGSIEEMERALVALSCDESRRRSIGVALRARVEADYSLRAMAGRIERSLKVVSLRGRG